MKKIFSFVFVVVVLLCTKGPLVAFGPQKDDVFSVKRDCFVPVFAVEHPAITFHGKAEGIVCYDLDTVLMAYSVVRVIDAETENIRIKYFINCVHRGVGFIPRSFFETSMRRRELTVLETVKMRLPIPPSLQTIRATLQKCIDDKVPFCYGANNFEKIDLDGKCKFFKTENISGRMEDYELRGFDCSGILHYMSNGTLPHSTEQLVNYGEKIFAFSGRRYSTKEKKAVLKIMEDSDYIIFLHKNDKEEFSGSGHVLVFYNGGFLEFKWTEPTAVYTPKEKTLEKLDALIKDAEKAGSDLYVIRWHPELLNAQENQSSHRAPKARLRTSEKFPLDFPDP
ncbi:MAG: hypothetical protein LBI56_02000 [Puniceicoccales bacterium]|jgi:hypothetical protein|nr:hypothetical protein [Puniceicoccales bacterium]